MNTVISKTWEELADYCPLRSDVNSCNVMQNSTVNECPVYDCVNDRVMICLKCPLLRGQVVIQLDRSRETF